eukprot:scaffold3973_cov161-Amphora_coffeaeformis.AAC.4
MSAKKKVVHTPYPPTQSTTPQKLGGPTNNTKNSMSEAETMARVAAAATAAVAAGMTLTGRKEFRRHIQEEEVEIMLSDRLVEGCVLMEKSCPACVTPLLKQMDGLLEPDQLGDNSLKRGKSHETSKSNQTLTPINGVPFCVACQAHVVTSPDEIQKVEEQKQSLKDMVLTALALEDEPLFVCNGTPADREMLKEMDDDLEEEQGYEVIKPEQWKVVASVSSSISKASSSERSKKTYKSMLSTKSQKKRSNRLNFEVADDGEVEIVRARSSFSNTPNALDSKTSRKTDTSLNQASIKESVGEEAVQSEQRQDENAEKKSESPDVKEEAVEDGMVEQKDNSTPHEDEHEGEIVITPDLVDKTPEGSTNNSTASSIAEIDVKKECSVDHEDLTADIITINESDDEWLSYEEK